MLDKPQSQSLDGSGNALQAGNDIHLTVNRGMSYSDVREIALDIVRANLQEFRGQAIEIAQARAEAVTDKFLQKLMSENPIGLQQAQTPDFQDALFTVQKEHAKAGDEDLADLLVDLLVDRTKQTGRNLMQLVLNEALHTAPKLPGSHVAALSVIFLLRHVSFSSSTSAAQLGANIQRFLSAIDTDIGTSESTFSHLKFTGCGANESFSHVTLEEIWLAEYPGLFRTGFGSERLDDLQVSPAIVAALKIPCVNDVTKFQLSPLTHKVLDRILSNENATEGEANLMRSLYAETAMSVEQVNEKMLSVTPALKGIADIWRNSELRNFRVTSVGMAIGHANIKRRLPELSHLGTWVQ